MLNLLEDYIWRSLPEWGAFQTNPNLRAKVDENGNFLPFIGNTTVFLLSDEIKSALEVLQQELYDTAGWMLSEKLAPSTFHMTLHDLANGCPGAEGLQEWMEQTERDAGRILAQWRNQPPLRMRTTWMFNMVSTSIVLGLAPADHESRVCLETMYDALEAVRPLGYGLTPHITMGYYRPGVYSAEEVNALRRALHPVALEVDLRMGDLVLQRFENMNRYITLSDNN